MLFGMSTPVVSARGPFRSLFEAGFGWLPDQLGDRRDGELREGPWCGSSAGPRGPEHLVTGLEVGHVLEYPHLAETITEHITKSGYDYADEFEVGVDLILDGIEWLRDTD